jgi:hypothetical protein
MMIYDQQNRYLNIIKIGFALQSPKFYTNILAA